MCYLLGFRFTPRIRDLNERRLYALSSLEPWPTLRALFAEPGSVRAIKEHWEETLRLAASIGPAPSAPRSCCASWRGFHASKPGSPLWLRPRDAGYGLSAPFRQALSERELAWAVGIPGLVLLPLQLLSGGATPRESMPEFVQTVMLVAPTTHFVQMAQAIDVAWPQFLAIAGIGAVFFVVALARFRRTIGTMA